MLSKMSITSYCFAIKKVKKVKGMFIVEGALSYLAS